MIRAPLARGFLWLEARLDALFGARWNPLYQLGALGFFYYWIVAVSGLYLYIFFDTGTTEAYESVDYLTREQWYLGGVQRSFHRYASDGLVLMMAVHVLREFAFGRFKGPRWFTWVTGVPIAGLVIVSGITGYWLVWDQLAQYIAVQTAEWLDWLGIFGEPIVRNFLTPESLDDRFFTLLIFIHIAVPLLALLALWIHLQRITRPAINPNRGLALGTFAMLVALSLIKPALSHPPADLSLVPAKLHLDWYYLFAYPLMEVLSNGAVWAILLTVSLALLVLPWLPPRWTPRPAVVHLESCNGCGRCADDCPYEAILMRPRSDDLPFEQEARVTPALCVSCGICAGACPPATPFRRKSRLVPGIELPDLTVESLRERLERACAEAPLRPRIVVFGCDHGVPEAALAGCGAAVVRQPCIAAFPPSFIDYALSRDLAEGVLITGCRDGACAFRFGTDWTTQRIEGRRDPYLRKRVPRARIRIDWAAANEGARLRASIQSFREDLQRLETPEADADADAGADSGDRGPDSAPRAAAGAQGHA
jgi:ferredoxin/coenzyme F420-reducing hydrogenase delta subunit